MGTPSAFRGSAGTTAHTHNYVPKGKKRKRTESSFLQCFFCNIDKYMKMINNIIVQFDDIEGLTLR